MISVFLGGTCNQSTWRDELLTMLDQDKVKAFNPVVDDWNEEAQINEDWHKANDDFCLYVLTPEMTGIYSIFEWLMIVINVLIEQYFVYFQKEMEKPLVSVFKKNS